MSLAIQTSAGFTKGFSLGPPGADSALSCVAHAKANLLAHRGRRVHLERPWRRCAFALLVVIATSRTSRGAVSDAAPLVESAATSLDSFDDVANQLLSRMTLAEKIGQMTQAELGSLGDLSDVSRLALGSVLCGGGSDPRDGNGVAAWAHANDACQKQALASRLKVPLLFGVDAMHGHSNVLDAVIFPHNIGLGCTRDAALVKEIGKVTAQETRATGINWAFAPCVTAPQDDRWGRTYEGYSEDSNLCVSRAAARAIRSKYWHASSTLPAMAAPQPRCAM
jgi:beta-glucosidase